MRTIRMMLVAIMSVQASTPRTGVQANTQANTQQTPYELEQAALLQYLAADREFWLVNSGEGEVAVNAAMKAIQARIAWMNVRAKAGLSTGAIGGGETSDDELRVLRETSAAIRYYLNLLVGNQQAYDLLKANSLLLEGELSSAVQPRRTGL